MDETAFVFAGHGAHLVGILNTPADVPRQAVLVVVGGPQYRVGSHRQFTLLCRSLASDGVAAMRFDYRGMGDAEGAMQSFEDAGPDVRAAVDELLRRVPSVNEVTVWGLCDGASAALLHAQVDRRVRRLVLLNPWIREATSYAKTTLSTYYWSRLADPEFWRKVARGEFAFRRAARGFAKTVVTAAGVTTDPQGDASPSQTGGRPGLAERMRRAFDRFDGRTLIILSGRDLTASEFMKVTSASPRWRRLLARPGVERREVPHADHTFSRREWSEEVARWTAEWVKSP